MSIVLTLAVFTTWISVALALAAIGVAFFHRAGGAEVESSWEYAYDAVWAGLALLMLVLLLWHFFLPLNLTALAVVTGAAAAAGFAERRWFVSLLKAPINRPAGAVMAAAGFWAANHALSAPGMDDFNYEFQAIRWFHDYPLVPGLANLHGRLGFNNSHHLLGALLSTGVWSGHVNHLVNGFVVTLALAYVLYGMWQICLGSPSERARWFFPALLVSPCLGLVLFGVFGPMLGTLKADVFVAAGVALLACVYLRSATAEPGTSRYAVTSATALLMTALLFSVKINAAAFCAVIAAVILWRQRATDAGRGAMHRGRRLVMVSAAAAVTLVGAVVVRGIVLSGYPLYPLERFGAPVDWRVPEVQVQAERLFVKAWSQLRPSYDFALLDNWDWLGPWAQSLSQTERLTILFPLGLTLALVSVLPRPSVTARPYLVLLAASGAALAVWFTQAPAARLAAAYFWVIFAAVAAWIDAAGNTRNTARRAGLLAAICFLIGFSQVGERLAAHLVRGRISEIRRMLWEDVEALPEGVSAPYDVRQTESGLTVYVAKATRYDTPLPNTRYFNRFLELRDPPHLDGGFRNAAPNPSFEYGYTVDYVMQPNGGTEIVGPQP